MGLTDMPPLSERSDDELLLPPEAAGYLRITVSTLESWRRKGRSRGPEFQRLGDGLRAPVRYPVGALRDWLAAHRSTGGDTPADAA